MKPRTSLAVAILGILLLTGCDTTVAQDQPTDTLTAPTCPQCALQLEDDTEQTYCSRCGYGLQLKPESRCVLCGYQSEEEFILCPECDGDLILRTDEGGKV